MPKLGFPYYLNDLETDIKVAKNIEKITSIRPKLKEIREDESIFVLSSTIIGPNENPELLNLGLDSFIESPPHGFQHNNFTICDEFLKSCYDLSYLPKTQTFVLTNDSFCELVKNHETFVGSVSSNLNIDRKEAVNEIAKFFQDKTILVQPKGVQGILYKVGTYAQTAGSAGVVGTAISMARVAGVSGMQMITAQPYLLIAVPTVGAMFFHGCGILIGNNSIGTACFAIGDTLNQPMRYTELMVNRYFAPVFTRATGIPFLLNYTQQARFGPGYTIDDAIKVFNESKPSIKKKVFKWLSKKFTEWAGK